MAAEEPLQKQQVSPPATAEEEPQPEQERQQPEPGENVEEQQLETPQEEKPQPEGEEAKQDSEQPEAGEEERRDAGGEEGEKEQGDAETAEEARVNEPEPTDQEKEQVLLLQQRSRESSQAKEEEEEEEEEEKIEEAEDKEEEEEQIRGTAERSELVLLYMTLCTERDKLQHQSMLLQHKLAANIRRRKSLESRRSSAPRSLEKAPLTPAQLVETEQRYLRILDVLNELRAQYISDTAQCKQQAEELAVHCHEILKRVDTDWRVFQERTKQVALAVLSRRGGRQAAAEEVELIHAREQRKEETLVQVRLENIKLKDQVRELEQELRASEELADGLHLIDFEQLKIENQTYNEKIEERNEELLKLRRKITSTVHILAHLKEKLQFVQAENQTKKEHLAQVEAAVAYRRDILTKTKQARDSLRISNVKLRQKCGLLGNEALLRDFEEKKDASDELGHRLETLKRRHAELTLNCTGFRKKIKEVKEAKEAKTALQK